MGIALLLIIALVVWGYLKAREQRLEAAKRQKKIEEQYEEQKTREQRLEADREEAERRIKIQKQYEARLRAREQRLDADREEAEKQRKIEEQRARERRLEADRKEAERLKRLQEQEEKLREREQRLKAATSKKNQDEESKKTSTQTRESPPVKRDSKSIKTTTSSTEISEQKQRTNSISAQNKVSLNTGIAELDGPGMFYRLTRLGPSASAVYLLHSEKHKAYKVGYCDTRGIAKRIRQIQPEVPDVKLVGTAVFTSNQKAFNAEQKILDKYLSHKYSGIYGRYSGSTEWITQRPTGRPFLTKPSSVEEKYQEELEAPEVRPIEEDNYTVYLMNSPSKGMYRVSWCKTENLSEKLRKARNKFADDVKIISRFPIQTLTRARGAAIGINEKAETLKTEGQKIIFEWASNPSYLSNFRDWDKDGKKLI